MITRTKNNITSHLGWMTGRQQEEQDLFEQPYRVQANAIRKPLQRRLRKFGKEFTKDLATTSRVGAISYALGIYYRSIKYCPVEDAICTNHLNKMLGYITFSFAIADFISYMVSRYPMKNWQKPYSYWHSYILDTIRMHGFSLQLILFAHQEIVHAFNQDKDDKEITTSVRIFIAEVWIAALLAVVCNPKIRKSVVDCARTKIFRYQPITDSEADTRSFFRKGVDSLTEFMNGFAAGRGWLFGFESVTGLQQSMPAIWVRWAGGLLYGSSSAVLALKYPPHKSGKDIFNTQWPDRIQITLSAVLYTMLTAIQLYNLDSHDQDVQLSLFSFLLLAIFTWSCLTKCCRNHSHSIRSNETTDAEVNRIEHEEMEQNTLLRAQPNSQNIYSLFHNSASHNLLESEEEEVGETPVIDEAMQHRIYQRKTCNIS